jgi:hypothetical protein
MAWLLALLVVISGCARAPLETPPCAGYWTLDTARLIKSSDDATGLRVCVTTSRRHCNVLSLGSIRWNGGFGPIPANQAALIRDLTVQVLHWNDVLRRAHLTRLAFPRLADMSFCHRVEIRYEPATGALLGVIIR